MIPSLYPSFRTGIHWTVGDIRGQVSRAIHTESGSARQSSEVGNGFHGCVQEKANMALLATDINHRNQSIS